MEDRRRARIDEHALREEYGGFHFGAAFYGWLVATGLSALLTALISAAGAALALTSGTKILSGNAPTIGILGAILLAVDLGISYYAGGYVSGRMTRFDGGRQGLGVWLIGAIMTFLLAATGIFFGSNYNLLQQLNIPHIPVSQGSLTTGGLLTLIAVAVITLLAAVAGGKMGERYHRIIDRVGRTTVEPEAQPTRGYSRRPLPTFGETVDRKRPQPRRPP